MSARLYERYRQRVVPVMTQRFGYTNPMAVPRLRKIVVSMGVGAATQEKGRLDVAAKDLAAITGQKPVLCKARKSVSNFKLREGMLIGAKVTLRRARMYEFFDRLVSAALPRVRDFRGLDPNGFDARGNYNMGLAEQAVFPEIDVSKIEFQQGMNVTVVTSAKTDEEARVLLALLGMPFRDLDESTATLARGIWHETAHTAERDT